MCACCEEDTGKTQGWVTGGGGTSGTSDPDSALPSLPRALQRKSRMQQQDTLAAGLAATAAPCGVAGDLVQHQHSPQRLQCPCGAMFLPSRVVLLENGGSGTAPSTMGRGKRNILTEQGVLDKACLPLGPPALHGTFKRQPLSLNPPTYLSPATSWGHLRNWSDKSMSRCGGRSVPLEKLGRGRLVEVHDLPSVFLAGTSRVRTSPGAQPSRGQEHGGSPWCPQQAGAQARLPQQGEVQWEKARAERLHSPILPQPLVLLQGGTKPPSSTHPLQGEASPSVSGTPHAEPHVPPGNKHGSVWK